VPLVNSDPRFDFGSSRFGGLPISSTKMQGHRSRIPRGCTGLGRAYGMHAGAFGASFQVRCGSKMLKDSH